MAEVKVFSSPLSEPIRVRLIEAQFGAGVDLVEVDESGAVVEAGYIARIDEDGLHLHVAYEGSLPAEDGFVRVDNDVA